MKNIEHYLKPGAIVPVNNETTKALVDALKEAREALAGAEGERQPEQEPVIGTKTWFEDGKVVTQRLTAKDIYKDPEQPEHEFVRGECVKCGASIERQEPVAVYVGETWCGSVVRLYEDLPLETPLYLKEKNT